MRQVEAERQRRYDRSKRNKEHAAFYSSRQWIKVQGMAKERYSNMDIYALYAHGVVKPGRIAHHIIPLADDWEKRFDLDNLIFVSDVSHAEIHSAYDSGDMSKRDMMRMLKQFQTRWREEGGAGGAGS